MFLEFVEFLLCCSKYWYTAKEQKQCATVNPVVVVTSATNVQVTEVQSVAHVCYRLVSEGVPTTTDFHHCY